MLFLRACLLLALCEAVWGVDTEGVTVVEQKCERLKSVVVSQSNAPKDISSGVSVAFVKYHCLLI